MSWRIKDSPFTRLLEIWYRNSPDYEMPWWNNLQVDYLFTWGWQTLFVEEAMLMKYIILRGFVHHFMKENYVPSVHLTMLNLDVSSIIDTDSWTLLSIGDLFWLSKHTLLSQTCWLLWSLYHGNNAQFQVNFIAIRF